MYIYIYVYIYMNIRTHTLCSWQKECISCLVFGLYIYIHTYIHTYTYLVVDPRNVFRAWFLDFVWPGSIQSAFEFVFNRCSCQHKPHIALNRGCLDARFLAVCMYECMNVCNECVYVCMYVSVCVCVCIYIYIYIYIYIHTHTHSICLTLDSWFVSLRRK